MGIFDEFKRLAHPYEDEEEDDFDDFDISPALWSAVSARSAPPAAKPL